jgi:ribosomal protein L18
MSDAPELPKVILAEITYRNLAGIGGDWFTMKTDEKEISYTRTDLHDAALARIAELEAERDAAYAEGYRTGVEAAAKACDKIAGNTADFDRDHRRAAGQCAAMVRALRNSEAEP